MAIGGQSALTTACLPATHSVGPPSADCRWVVRACRPLQWLVKCSNLFYRLRENLFKHLSSFDTSVRLSAVCPSVCLSVCLSVRLCLPPLPLSLSWLEMVGEGRGGGWRGGSLPRAKCLLRCSFIKSYSGTRAAKLVFLQALTDFHHTETSGPKVGGI